MDHYEIKNQYRVHENAYNALKLELVTCSKLVLMYLPSL